MPAAFDMPENWEQDTVALLPDIIWTKINLGTHPLLKLLPIQYTDASKVRFDRYQNPFGLMPMRGPDAAPPAVDLPGLETFEVEPGFYGMYTMLRESEMMFSRQPNTVNEPLDIAERLNKMLLDASVLVVNRFLQIAGTLFGTGEIENVSPDGKQVHKYKVKDYQTFTPANDGNTGPGWAADPINADPIGDLVYYHRRKFSKGTDANFDPEGGGKIKCNPTVPEDMWRCQSVREKFKSRFGSNVVTGDRVPAVSGGKDDPTINNLLIGHGLPPLEVIPDGYYETEAGAIAQDPDQFTYAIPDKTLIWAGVRPEGQPLGALKLTRHAGVSAYQIDKFPKVTLDEDPRVDLAKGIFIRTKLVDEMPVHYRTQMGFNACPLIYYRRACGSVVYT